MKNLALVIPSLLISLPIQAAPSWSYQVDLMTVGPGAALHQRLGQTALVVARARSDQPNRPQTQVYKLGDAYFERAGFSRRMLSGAAVYRVSAAGMFSTVAQRLVKQGRSVSMQRLNLTQAQARALRGELDRLADSARGSYAFDLLRRTSATRARDLLDSALGGVIKDQLAGQPTTPGGPSARQVIRPALAGLHIELLQADMLLGRTYDAPLAPHQALFAPATLARTLPRVQVTDPAGSGQRVPLASPPRRFAAKRSFTPPGGLDVSSTLAWMSAALLLILGTVAWLRAPGAPRLAGIWIALGPLAAGALGLSLLICGLASPAQGSLDNLWLLAFPCTDLALVAVGLRWLLGSGRSGRLLRVYSWLRAGLTATLLAGSLTGLLAQQPLVWLAPAAVCAGGLVALVRRMDN